MNFKLAAAGFLFLALQSPALGQASMRPLPEPAPLSKPAAVPAALATPAPSLMSPQRLADMREAVPVAERLAAQIPSELTPYFDVYLYVSKAAEGAWAQRMFVFDKQANGSLTFRESFLVSTGRERSEQYFTRTPEGIYKLDPNRFFKMVRSQKWNGARMPFAMFLDYSYRTTKTGMALHGAIGDGEVERLGQRASGGCIRIPMEKVEQLYNEFNERRGLVPEFAFDDVAGTTNRKGMIVRDAKGRPVLAEGVRVLLIVDTYEGDGTGPTVALEE